jgi:alkylation response protein AidB-like acyl-CoA dehydrogenase
MRFAFSDDQLALRDAVRDLLARECGPAVVRAAWDAPPGMLDCSVWDQLADMGVLHVLVAESDGGLGLDYCSLVLLLEESGRVALPHPLVDTAAVAAPLMARATSSLIGASLGASSVPCGQDVDAVLLEDRGSLRLVPRHAVRLRAVETVDRARRLAAIEGFDQRGDCLSDEPDAVDAAFDRGALGTAAQLVGLGQAMLDLTVDYVRQRQQFGVAVGSFQAVKHHLADALKELAFARPAVYRAAYSVAHDLPTRTRDVSMAKAMASDAAMFAGRQALQCHGAIGYTVEYDLHLYLKRSWALARAWGDAGWHRRRVGAALGLQVSAV